MGIDVYLGWPNQTEEEKQAQYTGWSVEHGHVGYLREAYHGSPYATEVLMPEGFDSGFAHISAKTLRDRLPKVIEVAKERERVVYGAESVDDDNPVVKSYIDFVELAEKMEQEHGKIWVRVSA